MFYGIRDRFKRWRFNFQVRKILDTPPASFSLASPAVLLSQLQHKDLRMFLLAAKSFMARIPISHAYVINDGTLTAEDKKVLYQHVPKLTIFELADFRSLRCPSGGTWERLLAIAELVKRHYVIQLDSDTLTVDDIPELRTYIENDIGFTIGTWDNQTFETMRARCEIAQSEDNNPDAHVQQVAEANFSKLKNYDALRYVRGCSGFAGFPKDSFSKEFVEKISSEMEGAIGSKWREWGSEQVMSNIVVSNLNNAVVLPHPKYSSCDNGQKGGQAFIHFIGYCRFNCGIYAKLGRQTIEGILANRPSMSYPEDLTQTEH